MRLSKGDGSCASEVLDVPIKLDLHPVESKRTEKLPVGDWGAELLCVDSAHA